MNWKPLILILLAFFVPATAQNPLKRLITQPIDEAKLVRLHGNIHPMAQARYDRGAVPDSFPADRVLLLLDRPAERETALGEFMGEVHRRGSASYHRWLTPLEYGQRFGPADSDIQAAEGWLRSHGFNVARVTKSKQVIEFSGTAGQLRRAFHTEIHQYSVEGETHYANAGEISIPAALAPLVRGVSPLNDFRAKPQLHVLGSAAYSRATKRTTPQWTLPNGNTNFYAVAPEDFATQYDLTPLYQAGVNGSGQTIGIINESNIDISLVNAYQQLFGLSSNPTQVVIDGSDPGVLNNGVDNDVAVEAYLDVEMSGAVAPKATVNLYIASGSPLQDPLALAAIRAIEDNQASVLSLSFGNCEATLGNAGNQFWSGLWEQAAAQGQTVFVSSGDSGPICYVPSGPGFGIGIGVSGLTSTPWNVSVGGTDFYYSDYASGAPRAATLWNQTNDSNLGSLKAPLPEQGWSDGFGLDVVILPYDEFVAGGGGASNCVVQGINPFGSACSSGYAKPSWQTGPGVLTDGVRDLPDVSLFASNGANLSATPICAIEGECAPGIDSTSESEIFLVGGTSVSSPAMAGIMALVNQKYGRQGQANFTLYPLAQQKPTAFHDVTLGNNEVLCPGPPVACTQNGSTTVYSAGPNYDQASGLGSVDANVLVNNWNSITVLPTTTALSLSSTKITHGTPITVTTSVAPTSGSGTPTGDVAILANSPLPSSQAQTFLTLSGGAASGSIDFFPGGTYQVSASYHGDGVFGSSNSSPVSLTVTPENSSINFQVLQGNALAGTVVVNGSTVPYNSQLSFNIQPVGVSASAGTTNGKATGTATFTLDSINTTLPLNAAGVASWTTSPALAVGTHTTSATYSGDTSLNASSGSPVTFSVTKGTPYTNYLIEAPQLFPPGGGLFYFYTPVGSSLTASAEVGPTYYLPSPAQNHLPLGTASPTGTLTVCLSLVEGVCVNPVYSQTGNLASPSGAYSSLSKATVTFTNLAAGIYFPSFTYSGDATWLPAEWDYYNAGITVDVIAAPSLAPSTTALSITPSSISGTELATFTFTVTGTASVGIAPTGPVQFWDNGIFFIGSGLIPANTGVTSSFTFQLDPSYFWTNGSNQITAIYQGDNNYLPSTSNVVNEAVMQSGADFTLTPQLPQISVKSGSKGTAGLNLASTSFNGVVFNGVVTLACTPSSSEITCSVNPSAPTVNPTATATLTVNAFAQTAGLPAHLYPGRTDPGRLGWLGAGGGFMLASVFLGGMGNRKRRLATLLSLGLLATLFVVAGCGSGGSHAVQPPPPASAGTYSVLVSATANGIVHNAKITVIVP